MLTNRDETLTKVFLYYFRMKTGETYINNSKQEFQVTQFFFLFCFVLRLVNNEREGTDTTASSDT